MTLKAKANAKEKFKFEIRMVQISSNEIIHGTFCNCMNSYAHCSALLTIKIWCELFNNSHWILNIECWMLNVERIENWTYKGMCQLETTFKNAFKILWWMHSYNALTNRWILNTVNSEQQTEQLRKFLHDMANICKLLFKSSLYIRTSDERKHITKTREMSQTYNANELLWQFNRFK